MDESKSLSYLQFNFLMYLNANYSNYFCFKMALWPASAMISFSCLQRLSTEARTQHADASCLLAFTLSESSTPE